MGNSKIAYVVKMYPRFSETFIVSEILAHESAGLDVEIFSLRPPVDTHFQDLLARVKSPVRFIPSERPRVQEFWSELAAAGRELPHVWASLGEFACEDPRDVYQAVRLAMMLREGAFTHIHAHFASVATTVARMAARFAELPYSFTAHAKDIYHESVDHVDLRKKLTDAAAVVTVSDYNAAYLREHYGTAATRVCRIYNGLHLDNFSFSPPLDRSDVVVAVGRLVEKKGFDDLIRAVALLRDGGSTVQCEIIGGGPMEADLQALIADLRIGGRVRLLGPLPQGEMSQRVASASVLAAPCVNGTDGNRDGLPTILLEAMALGTPCVGTAVAGIPEVVRDGDTGILIEERDVAALARAIERLVQDPQLRMTYASAARRLVEAQFDAHLNAARVRQLFEKSSASSAEAA